MFGSYTAYLNAVGTYDLFTMLVGSILRLFYSEWVLVFYCPL